MICMHPKPQTTLQSADHCLIRYLEIWEPLPEDSDRLRRRTSAIIEPSETRSVNCEHAELAIGSGLAGSAYQQKSVVIFQDRPCVTLDQIQQHTGLSLESLVAIPLFAEGNLINVVVLGLDSGYGGLEIWSRDDRDELSVSGSYYRGLDSFEYMSQFVRFPKGAGLPGHCWKYSEANMVIDPGRNPNFVRSFDQDVASLTNCLGIPISRAYGFPASVLLLLSASGSPFAKRCDIVKFQWDAIPEDGSPTSIVLAPIKSSDLVDDDLHDWYREIAESMLAAPQVKWLTNLRQTHPHSPFHAGLVLPVPNQGQTMDLVSFLF